MSDKFEAVDVRAYENMGYRYEKGFAYSLLTKKKYSGMVGFQSWSESDLIHRIDIGSQLILIIRRAHESLRPPGDDSPDTKYLLSVDGICTDLPIEVHAGDAFVLPNGFRD